MDKGIFRTKIFKQNNGNIFLLGHIFIFFLVQKRALILAAIGLDQGTFFGAATKFCKIKIKK